MVLNVSVKQQAKNAWVVSLEGSLDSATAQAFGERIQPLLGTAGSTLVLDMDGLEYISSAGLREIFKAQKAQKAAPGKLVFMRLKPQIRKVFDIVNALPSMRIFSSLREMDDYLDRMQKQVTGKGDPDD
jgi:anti-anti-sigma factor